MPRSSLPSPIPPPRAPVVLSSSKSSAKVPSKSPKPSPPAASPAPTNPIRAAMVFRRDGIKVSRVVMTSGSELPVHSVDDDVVIVVIRGVGIVFAQQEPRHVEAGSIVDLVPGEEHSVECIEELEFVICQVSLASRIVTAPPVHPAG